MLGIMRASPIHTKTPRGVGTVFSVGGAGKSSRLRRGSGTIGWWIHRSLYDGRIVARRGWCRRRICIWRDGACLSDGCGGRRRWHFRWSHQPFDRFLLQLRDLGEDIIDLLLEFFHCLKHARQRGGVSWGEEHLLQIAYAYILWAQ